MKNKGFYAVFAVLMSFGFLVGAGSLSTQQILNNAYDSTTGTISLSMSQGTWKDTTALTNTITTPAYVEHTTTATPADGIGVGYSYIQEGEDGQQTVGYTAVILDDVSSGTEDASFSVALQEAGAAAAEKFAVESTGVVTLVGGATLDNDTSSTNLNITETNVTITGNEVVTGSVDITGAAGLILSNDETITNAVNGTIAMTGAVTVSSDLGVDTDVLSVDATNDIVEVNGWYDMPYQNITSSPYSIESSGKAAYFVVNYTDTGAASVVLDTDLTVDGRVLTIKDGELNANANNITIGTEGAETIDEAATYTIDADGEAVTLISDGTNWFVIGGYLE